VELSKEKTKISHIDQGFDFLGFNLRKYKGKLLIKPAKDKTLKHRRSVRETIKQGFAWQQDMLIRKLNPILRGWANFYRHQVSKETFNRNDTEVWKTLWQWAKRRHPHKNCKWIIRKYFKEIDDRKWIFNNPKSGLKIVLQAYTPITRHSKIKGDCNPYDPEWKEYLQSRVTMENPNKNLSYRERILLNQSGICPICRTLLDLDDEEQIDLHHIIPRKKGGTDQMSNIVILHTNCHRSIHHRKDLQPADNEALPCLSRVQ
jgi:RNA-directed DNA polymerase